MSTLSLICLNLPAQKAESAKERKTSASLIHVQETGREDGHHQSWCSEKTQLRKKKGFRKKKKKEEGIMFEVQWSGGRLCCVAVSCAQSCLTLGKPLDCSPPGSSVYGIFQARILEWVAIPSLGDLPNPGIELASPALQVYSLRLFWSKYLLLLAL